MPWLLAQPQTEITASAGALTDDNKLTEATCAVEATIRALCICGSIIRARATRPRRPERPIASTQKAAKL